MMDIPEAISNLKLCRAFKGHNPDIMDCVLSIADKEFFVEDSREVGCTIYTVKKIDDKSCKVSNSTDEAVILLPIDGKFIINHKGGMADSALFNTKDFHFVEFKSNAEGNTDNAVMGTYSKAMDQLSAADSDEEAHEDKEPVMGGDPEDAPKKYTEKADCTDGNQLCEKWFWHKVPSFNMYEM